MLPAPGNRYLDQQVHQHRIPIQSDERARESERVSESEKARAIEWRGTCLSTVFSFFVRSSYSFLLIPSGAPPRGVSGRSTCTRAVARNLKRGMGAAEVRRELPSGEGTGASAAGGRPLRLPASLPGCPASRPSPASPPVGCPPALAAPARCYKSPARKQDGECGLRHNSTKWLACGAWGLVIPARHLCTAPSCP